MRRRHIPFWKLEADDAIDQNHLEACGACRRNYDAARLLAYQTKYAPQVEAPPFFAARVARLAQETPVPILVYFQQVARRWVPVLSALIVATGFLIVSLTRSQSGLGIQALEESTPAEITLENLVYSFSETAEEAPDVEQPE
jgi:predicted anti-sigma-YlaC factor YlaD